MAQGNKTQSDEIRKPTHDIFWTIERFDSQTGAKKGSSWFRCGAIWPVKDHPEMLNIDVELLNPATGEPIKFRFVAKQPE